MVTLSTLLVSLAGVAGSFASPVDLGERDTSVAERGPFDFTLGPHDLTSRATVNYDQNYVSNNADVIYTPSGNSFNVKWSAPSSSDDFVVGVGWSTGSTSPISFSGSFGAGSGTGLLSVYGWSTNPLVEYYVVENSLNPPTFGTEKGTFTSDGATYIVYENTRVNEPSIEGTSTFNQYISVRQSKRSSGTVTISNHISNWASHGMSLGALSYQVIAIEGWGGQGEATQSVSN